MVNGPGMGKPLLEDSLAPDSKGLSQEVLGSLRVAQQGAEWERVVLGLCCSFPERD